MVLEAKKRGMPILGICQGSKVLNVIYGGTLDQDITIQKGPMKVNHDVMPLKGDLAHEVTVKQDTHLHDILVGNDRKARTKNLTMQVNSWHHTATKGVAENFIVNAVAPDGTIEGIEESYPGHPNCMGIQFHAEYIDKAQHPVEYERQSRIFKSFKTACLAYRHKRTFNNTLVLQFDAISKKLKKTITEVNYSPVVDDEEIAKKKSEALKNH